MPHPRSGGKTRQMTRRIKWKPAEAPMRKGNSTQCTEANNGPPRNRKKEIALKTTGEILGACLMASNWSPIRRIRYGKLRSTLQRYKMKTPR